MRRLSLAVVTLVALLGLIAGPAAAQWGSISTNAIRPADTTKAISVGPSSSSGCSVGTNGELSCTQGHVDSGVFLPAIDICRADSVNLTPTRVAASDWALARTAGGAETFNIFCSLNSWLERVGGTKGAKITGIKIVHQITTAALTSATWGKVATQVYANNTANAISGDLATGPTLPTASQANPYVTSAAMTTPAYLPGNSLTGLSLEYQVVMQNTGVYRLYGLWVDFTRLDH